MRLGRRRVDVLRINTITDWLCLVSHAVKK